MDAPARGAGRAPLRVLLVTHFYPAHGGGIERVAAEFAARLAASGCELVWCASDSDAPPSLDGVRALPMATWNGIERASGFPYPLWRPRALSRLAAEVRRCDAVHVHDAIYLGSLFAATLARRHGRRLVVSQHIGEVPLPAPLAPLLALANRVGGAAVLRRADAVGFVSPAVRHHFAQRLGSLPGFHDLANGVDADVFHPGPDAARARAAARRAEGFDPARPLLLFVGRFVPKKRLPIVRALAQARPDWQWCLVGHGVERPQDWGLPNVRVLSPRPQAGLVDLYRAADLLVLPSEGEGFPLVVQEAMACGLPPAVTAEVAQGGSMPVGAWVELPASLATDTAAGVAALAEALAGPAAVRAAHREACAAHARRHWSWDAATATLLGWLRGDGA